MPEPKKTPVPPRRSIARPERTDDGVEYDADSVAEQIEAGYDIQANAAVKPMSDDPASSSEGEIFSE